tara:strand:- start:2103 stop:3026 length:924 start_codon:yes stop_codon:yes gene_type:complete
MTKNKIILLIPYFGKWPEWFHLFFETMRRNEKIDFHFFTDCETQSYSASNVHFEMMNFDEYVKHAQGQISSPINIQNPYKICDLRPLFGKIHSRTVEGYDFFGWMDIDLLLGDISAFLTPEILNSYDVFSTHADRISGHFALFRNNLKNKEVYKRIYQWEEALNNPEFVGIDEYGITNAYTQTFLDKIRDKFKIDLSNSLSNWYKRQKAKKMHMVEQYTTPFLPKPWLDGSVNSEQPSNWTYIDGEITNNRDDRNFMYLHFMNFKNSQWRHDGTKAPWEGKDKICSAQAKDLKTGVRIDLSGIHPLI